MCTCTKPKTFADACAGPLQIPNCRKFTMRMIKGVAVFGLLAVALPLSGAGQAHEPSEKLEMTSLQPTLARGYT